MASSELFLRYRTVLFQLNWTLPIRAREREGGERAGIYLDPRKLAIFNFRKVQRRGSFCCWCFLRILIELKTRQNNRIIFMLRWVHWDIFPGTCQFFIVSLTNPSLSQSFCERVCGWFFLPVGSTFLMVSILLSYLDSRNLRNIFLIQ